MKATVNVYVFMNFQWFRDEVSKEEEMPEELLSLLFSHLDPIYELHCSFLKDIEQRMATWYEFGRANF